ncbi:MAG: elongation factor P, partial [Patescibacteria group bacterium]
MAMLGVQDIRNGTAFLLDGNPWLGLKYEHIKMGRGSATIKIKMRHLLTGVTIEKSFVNSARVEEISLLRKPMQYLYR